MGQPPRKSPTSGQPRRPGGRQALAARGTKASQRERLVEAMTELVARSGYQGVSVAQVSSKAGVSSATFYEQFRDKEDCLLAAYGAAAERLLAKTPRVAGGVDWEPAAQTTLSTLAQALVDDPAAGRLLFVEALGGGPRVSSARRLALDAFDERVREFIASAPADRYALDVPVSALIGAVRTIIARHLRANTEDYLPRLVDDGIAWVLSYRVEPGAPHWSTSDAALLPAAPPAVEPPSAGPPPTRLPRGRHGLAASVITRSQRTRIINATAEVVMEKGYAAATVADIVAAAGVSREVFYEHFADKQNAFLEAESYPTQYILEVCASAYFSVCDWPERIWRTFATLLRMIVENPAISYLRLIECYAAGPEAVRRSEEVTRSFTIFLEEGYRYAGTSDRLPRLYAQASAGAISEMIRDRVAGGDSVGLQRSLPQIVYVATAPFIGPAEAIATVERLARGDQLATA
jgi:AcrR family transcriptional regulator